jgi:ankyrin repeat protein
MGTDVNAKCKSGNTPLHIAALVSLSSKKEQLEIVEFLVSKGADVNAKNINPGGISATPLEQARQLGHPALVRVLSDAK